MPNSRCCATRVVALVATTEGRQFSLPTPPGIALRTAPFRRPLPDKAAEHVAHMGFQRNGYDPCRFLSNPSAIDVQFLIPFTRARISWIR
jgi:hypothetical protein